MRELAIHHLSICAPPLMSGGRSRNVDLRDVEVVLRVPYTYNDIRVRNATIGNGEHVINLLVMNFEGQACH